MSKYNSRKTVIDGIKFDSKLEAERYKQLKLLERSGEINNLKLQPKFEILKSYKYKGKTIRGVSYYADFMYYDKTLRKTVIEDVKGVKTDVYKLKIKLFIKRYCIKNNKELVEFREITRKDM